MITTTPIAHGSRQHHRDASIPSRPTTPLRPASRTSLKASQTTPSNNAPAAISNGHDTPLDRLEPAFAELSDAVVDLESNFMHLQLLNESIARFNENFASFLYGLNMTAFCVDFPEAPISQSFARNSTNSIHTEQTLSRVTVDAPHTHDAGADATFMTGDTSFVENPPMSIKLQGKYGANASTARRGPANVRGSTSGRAGTVSARGRAPVAGTDEYGRRITRLPGGASRARGSGPTRGRGSSMR